VALPKDNKLRISIMYPAAWKVEVYEWYYGIQITSTKLPAPSWHQPNFSIAIFPLESAYEGTTLEEVANEDLKWDKDHEENLVVDEEPTNTTLNADGNPARRIVFHSDFEGKDKKLQTLRMWSIYGSGIDKNVYTLSHYVQIEKYSEFKPIVDKIIRSFKPNDFIYIPEMSREKRLEYKSTERSKNN
jgi:hypothetical protein